VYQELVEAFTLFKEQWVLEDSLSLQLNLQLKYSVALSVEPISQLLFVRKKTEQTLPQLLVEKSLQMPQKLLIKGQEVLEAVVLYKAIVV
jgi:hypothetical protein